MDPNAAWDELCGLLNRWESLDPVDVNRIFEVSYGLRGWLGRGGFPPKKMEDAGLDRNGCMRLLHLLQSTDFANTLR